MKTYLLTWNPEKWPLKLFVEVYERWLRDPQTVEPWRSISGKPEPGDEVFLVRQGTEPRGLLAYGVVVSQAYHRPSGDGASGNPQRVVDVRFRALADPRDGPIVPRSELDRLPISAAASWDIPSSGILLPDDIAASLQELWNHHWASNVGNDWTAAENALIVQAYFKMLVAEINGKPFVKTRENEAVRAALRGRSRGSVEFKFMNISAVLEDLGYRRIDGYRPKENAQHLALTEAVAQFLDRSPDVLALLENEAQKVPTQLPPLPSFDELIQRPPSRVTAKLRPKDFLPRKWDPDASAERDQRNRKLGRAGEEWVCELERRRLREAGRNDLAGNVRWVSDLDGDGAGYDVLSYDTDGGPRHIEVKTTNAGPRTEFILSANEIAFSEVHPENYFLYRVHSFSSQPRFFILRAPLSSAAALEPTHFRVRFEQGAPEHPFETKL